MRHLVRPVWLALGNTTAPLGSDKRCQQSMRRIRRFFLDQTGRTFRCAELAVVPCVLEEGDLQRYRPESIASLDEVNRFLKSRWHRSYHQQLRNHLLFFYNTVGVVNELLDADASQAWVIFIPAREERNSLGVARALHVGPGGYAVISTNFLAKELATPDRPSFVYTLEGHTWGSGVRVEGLIAHELSHVLGLGHNTEDESRLMGRRNDNLADCTLSQREKETLRKSPFLIEDWVEG